MSRAHDRKDFDPDTRLRLVEGDMDKFDVALEGLQESMGEIKAWLVKSVIGLATGSAIVALDIVLRSMASSS